MAATECGGTILTLIRRDLLTVLTHNVASRQVAMGAWGKLALT